MSRLLGDDRITLLVKGFVLALLAIALANLVVEFRGRGDLTVLSGALVLVYVGVVLAVGVFTDRLFAPRTQIALFCGLTLYWAYDYLEQGNTLSILLVVLGLGVLAQQSRRLMG